MHSKCFSLSKYIINLHDKICHVRISVLQSYSCIWDENIKFSLFSSEKNKFRVSHKIIPSKVGDIFVAVDYFAFLFQKLNRFL